MNASVLEVKAVRAQEQKRIRVVHHPLQVHLLVAVRTRLFLTHNAPATDAELMESEVVQVSSGRNQQSDPKRS